MKELSLMAARKQIALLFSRVELYCVIHHSRLAQRTQVRLDCGALQNER